MRELPGKTPYATTEVLILEFQETWVEHADGCFLRVKEKFNDSLGRLVTETFGRFENLSASVRYVSLTA